MYLSGQPSPSTAELLSRMQYLTQQLLKDFDANEASVTLEGIDDLYDYFDRDKLFIVQDGMLHLSKNGQTLASFEEGDLVGVSHSFHMQVPILRTDEYVELVPIDRDDFLRHIYSDKRRQHFWSHYLICQNALLLNYLSDQARQEVKPTAGFQNFSAGEVIIKQGDVGDHVYTIISGEADVFVDNVKVGILSEDEVFGAMAAFTREPRTASVIAANHCTVMAVPQDDFVVLIEAQPKAAVNLIENLARRITIMNQQLIELSGQGHARE